MINLDSESKRRIWYNHNKGAKAKQERESEIKKEKKIIEVKELKSICVDCGCEMERPQFRINTNTGWRWLCLDCKNKAYS